MSGDQAHTNRTWRIAAMVAFGVGVILITGSLALQVILQAFWPEPSALPDDCVPALKRVVSRIERARQSAVVPAGERETLRRFRSSLGPLQAEIAALRSKCGKEPALSRALDLIEDVSYAEEQSLRGGARRLSRLRADLKAAMSQLSGGN